MIQSFKHRGLQKYFETGNAKGIPANMISKITRQLNVLDRAKELKDCALPGYDFHSLKGNRKGEYSITVTANYRLTFRFADGHVLDLNLEDYH